MHSLRKQGGWTFQGLLVFFLIAGFAGSVAAKLAPAYSDYFTLKQVIEGIMADPQELKKSVTQLRLDFNKKLGINNMKLPAHDSVAISKDKGDVLIAVDYEVRVPLYFNVDAVMSFKENFKAAAP